MACNHDFLMYLARMSPPVDAHPIPSGRKVHVAVTERGDRPLFTTGFVVRGPDQIGMYTVRIPAKPRHHYVFAYRGELEPA